MFCGLIAVKCLFVPYRLCASLNPLRRAVCEMLVQFTPWCVFLLSHVSAVSRSLFDPSPLNQLCFSRRPGDSALIGGLVSGLRTLDKGRATLHHHTYSIGTFELRGVICSVALLEFCSLSQSLQINWMFCVCVRWEEKYGSKHRYKGRCFRVRL